MNFSFPQFDRVCLEKLLSEQHNENIITFRI